MNDPDGVSTGKPVDARAGKRRRWNRRCGGRAGIRLALAAFSVIALVFGLAGTGVISAQDATPAADQQPVSAAPADSGAGAPVVTEPPTGQPPATDAPAPTEPPTAAPPAPTEAPATQPAVAPTVAPSPTPSPTVEVWQNHDTLTLSAGDPSGATPLHAGQVARFQFVYQVTTPRTGTTLTATLRDTAGNPAPGWQVRITSLDGAGEDWTGAGDSATRTEAATTTPDSSFTVEVAVRAPQTLSDPESATLFVSSTATTPAGSGEAALSGEAPLAQIQAIPLPPTPTPTATPSPTPSPTPSATVAAMAAASPVATVPAGSPDAAAPEPAPCVATAMPTVSLSAPGFGAATFGDGTYPSLTQPVKVTVSLPDATACLPPAWSVVLSASDMTDDAGNTIPAGAIGVPGVSGLGAPGLTVAGAVPAGSLAAPVTLVNGTGQTLGPGTTSTTFQVTLELSPPPDAPPGAYHGTISAEAVAAP